MWKPIQTQLQIQIENTNDVWKNICFCGLMLRAETVGALISRGKQSQGWDRRDKGSGLWNGMDPKIDEFSDKVQKALMALISLPP